MVKDTAPSVSTFISGVMDVLVGLLNKGYWKVLLAKVVIENAKQFSEAADRLCDITAMYLDAEDIKSPNLTDSIYMEL